MDSGATMPDRRLLVLLYYGTLDHQDWSPGCHFRYDIAHDKNFKAQYQACSTVAIPNWALPRAGLKGRIFYPAELD